MSCFLLSPCGQFVLTIWPSNLFSPYPSNDITLKWYSKKTTTLLKRCYVTRYLEKSSSTSSFKAPQPKVTLSQYYISLFVQLSRSYFLRKSKIFDTSASSDNAPKPGLFYPATCALMQNIVKKSTIFYNRLHFF